MTYTFKQFMEEGEAAPAMGSGSSSPSNPDSKNDASVGDMEMDIDPSVRDEIDKVGEFITSFKPLFFKSHGIKAAPPIFLQILDKLPNGSARVKVMYSLCNKNKMRNASGLPLQQPPEDQEAYLSRQELDDVRLGAFSPSAPAGGAGAAPDMGGMLPPPGGMI